MKKIKITLLVLFIALSTTLCFTTKVSAEEDSSSDTTTEDVVVENENLTVGAVYTYIEDEKTLTFTILNETQAECVISDGEQSATAIMDYSYIDHILTFSMLGEEIGSFTIGENNVLSFYEVPTPDTDFEDIVDDEYQPSDLQIWVEENLGWLVGIPTGTVLAVIADILVLANKNRKKKEEIEETSNQNKRAKAVLDTTKELLNDTKALAKKLETNVTDVLNLTEEKTALLLNGFENITKILASLENRLTQLEDVQEMIALHSKELVANGTAEKITKKIRG